MLVCTEMLVCTLLTLNCDTVVTETMAAQKKGQKAVGRWLRIAENENADAAKGKRTGGKQKGGHTRGETKMDLTT